MAKIEEPLTRVGVPHRFILHESMGIAAKARRCPPALVENPWTAAARVF